jgi:hypothetical protein
MQDETCRSAYETSRELLALALELDPAFDFTCRLNHHFWYPEAPGSLKKWTETYMRASHLSADRLEERYPLSDDAPMQGYYVLVGDPTSGTRREGQVTVATVAWGSGGPAYGVSISTKTVHEGD